jgi:hypothetical protein
MEDDGRRFGDSGSRCMKKKPKGQENYAVTMFFLKKNKSKSLELVEERQQISSMFLFDDLD